MKIKAVIPSFKEIEIDVPKNTRLVDLKKKLCRKIGIEPDLTKLLLKGNVLDEEKRVGNSFKELSKLEIDYLWSRQLIMWGIKGQKRIRNSTVFIAGAGALGNEVAKNLAMLGIKRLIIVDNDKVELSNINRMIFFERNDVGRSKAKVLAEKVNKRFPYVEVWASEQTLEDILPRYYLKSDLIMSCLDNILSRIFLTVTSRKYCIPLIDSGISGNQARVQTYIPSSDSCPICPFSIDRYGQFIGLKNPCDAPLEEIKIPSYPTTISLASSIQTQEAIKILIGHDDFKEKKEWSKELGRPLEGIWLADLSYNKYSIITVKKNKNCIVCGKNGVGKDIVQICVFSIGKSKNKTTELIKNIEKFSTEKLDEISISNQTGELKKIVKNRELSEYGIIKGESMQAILKSGDEYKEIIIKII
ncbi:MAG: ThiF family adenylyltransferase [Candidatus Bathyarchaeota archaeon]|nr:ThiF family adenylyltransferase [Candidatus Bathyarchaeota archaeon]